MALVKVGPAWVDPEDVKRISPKLIDGVESETHAAIVMSGDRGWLTVPLSADECAAIVNAARAKGGE